MCCKFFTENRAYYSLKDLADLFVHRELSVKPDNQAAAMKFRMYARTYVHRISPCPANQKSLEKNISISKYVCINTRDTARKTKLFLKHD